MAKGSALLRAAVVQLHSTADVAGNLDDADRLVRAAAADGARLVVLPEKWPCLGDDDVMQAGAQGLDGPAVAWGQGVAAELGIDLIAGSFAERCADGDALANTCVHLSREGQVAEVYRKVHLFDAVVDGIEYRESATAVAGARFVVTTTATGVRVGLLVCYDVRFGEQARQLALAGADVFAVPAAFTIATTRDHWEVLLRARAIENGCFVLGANQIGEHTPSMRSGGRSMIVDPWGVVLATVGDAPGYAVADLDLSALSRVREQLGIATNRRPEVYRAHAADVA